MCQCHVDLSIHVHKTWDYIRKFVEQYQITVFSLPEYRQALATNQHFKGRTQSSASLNESDRRQCCQRSRLCRI
jgi:hypothetical protein